MIKWDVLEYFADGWNRFPVGGNASMIANFLNDRAKLYYDVKDDDTAHKLVSAAGEIIFRSDRY